MYHHKYLLLKCFKSQGKLLTSKGLSSLKYLLFYKLSPLYYSVISNSPMPIDFHWMVSVNHPKMYISVQ